MSERVRARKEARERERRAKGLPIDMDSTDEDSGRDRETATLSPRAASAAISSSAPPSGSNHNHNHNHQHHQQQHNNNNNNMPLFGQPEAGAFNYQLPMPFNIPVSPDPSFPDFAASSSLDSALFKGSNQQNYSNMFNMFDDTQPPPQPEPRRSPITPPIPNPTPPQPDLLTRLKACCHLSDSHVVNDPGLLIFATRLCQSFPCSFGGSHPETMGISDSEQLMLEDSWKALKSQLDPVGEADGENRINTGRMAAELVCRAAHSRGPGWIVCRYREGMSIKRQMISQLIQGLGGKFD